MWQWAGTAPEFAVTPVTCKQAARAGKQARGVADVADVAVTISHQELLALRSRNSFVFFVMTLARELLPAVTKRIGS